MGKIAFILLCFIGLSSFASETPSTEPLCRFDMKDYDSAGFGIPKRSGFHIVGRFGCIYRCSCANGSKWKVTHVLNESHFDLDVLSQETGGPSRAKWFICPHSVQEDSWKPFYDELGRVIAYNVEPDYSDFPAKRMSSSPQIQDWMNNTCQKP